MSYVKVPAGVVFPFAGNSADTPDGYLFCDGSAVSRTSYAKLFSILGVSCGSGDGSTTFNLPDYRGFFHRGVDGGASRDPDAGSRSAMNSGGNTGDNVGSTQGHQYASHNHSMPYNGGNANSGITNTTILPSNAGGGVSLGYNGGASSSNTSMISNNGGNETRGINAYVNYIIKY